MSEATPVVEVVVNFRRQIQPQQYETAAAEVTLKQSFPGTMSPEEIQLCAQGLFQLAKQQTFDELGLQYEQNAEGLIMEAFPDSKIVSSKKLAAVRQAEPAPDGPYDEEEAFPDPEPVQRPQANRSRPVAAQSKPAPRAARAASGRGRPAPQPVDADGYWEDVEKNPGDWFDNRETKTNPKAPDFRHKTWKENGYNVGLWISSMPEWVELPDPDMFAS